MAASRTAVRFNEVADLGRTAGYDLGFRQLDSGPQSISAVLLPGEQFVLTQMRFNRRYHQLGSPPAGTRTFGIPVRGLRNWFGKDYEESSIVPFSIPGGFDAVSEAGFQAFAISVHDRCVQTVAEEFQIPVADVLVTPTPETVIRDGGPTQHFRRLISSAIENIYPQLDREREDEIVVALLHAALSDKACSDRSSPVCRSRAVADAITYITDNRGELVTVSDICHRTRTPLRTLNRAFRERFGMGPKAYLIRQRLSDVHAELLGAPQDTLIADVANRHEFWHMGQFAKDYRKLFGELPSRTLQRSRAGSR